MKLIAPFLLIFFYSNFHAQSTEAPLTNQKFKVDTNYIEDLSDKLVLRSFTKNKFNTLTLQNVEEGKLIRYDPNNSTSLGAGFNYHWLGIDLAIQLPKNEESKETYGNTRSFDFQTNMYLRKFSIDLSYVRYGGYFMVDINDSLGIDTVVKRKDIKTQNIGASINYIFNHKKFSYRAVYLQNERQKKSAGSWFTGIYFSRAIIDSERGFIPEHYWDLYPDTKDLQRARTMQIGLQGGYAHTFVISHFFGTLSLGAGLGYENLKFSDKTRDELTLHGVSPKFNIRGAIGYNSNRWTLSFQAVRDDLLVGGLRNNDVTYSYGSFRFLFAYRILPPKKWQILKDLNPIKLIKKN